MAKTVKKIVVGSTNPVKIGAVRDALGKLFPKAEYMGVEVESGVRAQPRSDEETMRGARNRARRALKRTKADLAVGLEGGVIEAEGKMMNTVWCCLLTKEGIESLAGGNHLELPKRMVTEIKRGREVGDIIDEISGEHNTKQKIGMIGVLTKGLIDRGEAYSYLVRLATVKLQSPELYT